jgi:hypothetical protein
MSYAIHIPPAPASLLETLPPRAQAAVRVRLARLAEAAEAWPVGDARWATLARQTEEELVFYANGCCVHLGLEPERRRLVVHGVGRVLVHLPARCA